MKLRGYLALAIVCVGLLLGDLAQRLVVVPWTWLRPSRRVPLLTRWINLMARVVTRPLNALGGAHIPVPARVVPSKPGILILMNHQSLFDIPLVVQSVEGGYPRIVTRKRYGRWIPLISQMIKLYQYPMVDPAANAGQLRKTYRELERTARTTDLPLALFPEGGRSRDGAIAPFRTNGLRLILRARPWTVYVLVADGFWKRPRFVDFAKGISGLSGTVELAGVLEWPDPEADVYPFIEEARRLMIERLTMMRERAEVA